MSKFYGIGVGPGSSELLTIKAVKVLNDLDILITPKAKGDMKSVALKIADEHIGSNVEIRERVFPMSLIKEDMEDAWNEISAEIENEVLAGKKVGFITLGDPMVYSTYIYLLKRLESNIPVETIAGITSFQGIASGNNFPLVEGDAPLLIYPCTNEIDKIEQAILNNDSIVLMKVYKKFKEIIKLIEKHELKDYSILVSNASKETEKVYKDVTKIDEEKISYFSTIIINKGWDLK